MSGVVWGEIKASKRFYVYLYRRSLNTLLISLLLNLIFGSVAIHLFLKRPGRIAYSSDGASPPVELSAMTAPNESSVPLLASDPKSSQEEIKVVPE